VEGTGAAFEFRSPKLLRSGLVRLTLGQSSPDQGICPPTDHEPHEENCGYEYGEACFDREVEDVDFDYCQVLDDNNQDGDQGDGCYYQVDLSFGRDGHDRFS